ncbi:MAG: 4Fe-4S binding protein [Planctomycetes bacterium]|nr:4Fe-4S binding protein [Planctomycetota bacterium]
MIDFVRDIYDGVKSFMVGMKVTGGYLGKNMVMENFGGKVDDDIAPNTVTWDGSAQTRGEVKVADRFRGHLHNDIERCIVCRNCSKACPIDCFFIDGEKTVSNKWRPSRFDIDILKCMYCGLCVFACPTGCLTMTKEWWGSTRAGTPDTTGGRSNLHGLIREFGVGFYTDDEKIKTEKMRIRLAEEKRIKAAEAAAKKAAAAKAAAAAKPAAAPAAAKPAVAPKPAAETKSAEGAADAKPAGDAPPPAS